jgi:hypothetical protein
MRMFTKFDNHLLIFIKILLFFFLLILNLTVISSRMLQLYTYTVSLSIVKKFVNCLTFSTELLFSSMLFSSLTYFPFLSTFYVWIADYILYLFYNDFLPLLIMYRLDVTFSYWFCLVIVCVRFCPEKENNERESLKKSMNTIKKGKSFLRRSPSLDIPVSFSPSFDWSIKLNNHI